MRAFECIFSYVQQEMSANFDVLQASFDEYFSAGELIVSEQWTIDPSFFSTLIKWQMFSKISLTWKKTKQSDWRLMHRRGLQTFLSEGCISYYTKDRGPCIFRNEVVSGWVTSSNTFFAIYIIFHFWQNVFAAGFGPSAIISATHCFFQHRKACENPSLNSMATNR